MEFVLVKKKKKIIRKPHTLLAIVILLQSFTYTIIIYYYFLYKFIYKRIVSPREKDLYRQKFRSTESKEKKNGKKGKEVMYYYGLVFRRFFLSSMHCAILFYRLSWDDSRPYLPCEYHFFFLFLVQLSVTLSSVSTAYSNFVRNFRSRIFSFITLIITLFFR